MKYDKIRNIKIFLKKYGKMLAKWERVLYNVGSMLCFVLSYHMEAQIRKESRYDSKA